LNSAGDECSHFPQVVLASCGIGNGARGECQSDPVKYECLGRHPGRPVHPNEVQALAFRRHRDQDIDDVRRRHPHALMPQGGRAGEYASRPGVQHGGDFTLTVCKRPVAAEIDTGKHGLPRSARPDPVPQGAHRPSGRQHLISGNEPALLA
jgi:hypothetical protein